MSCLKGTVENVEKHLQDAKFKDSHLDKAMKTIGLLSNKNSELENKIAALESRNAVCTYFIGFIYILLNN